METKIGIDKDQAIDLLSREVNELKKKLEFLESKKGVISTALERIWDNEYDEIWERI